MQASSGIAFGIAQVVLNLFALGVAFCVLNVAATRRFGRKGTWYSWAAFVLVIDSFFWWRFAQFPVLVEDRATTVYMIVAFSAIPTAFAAWFVSRKARSPAPPNALVHVLIGLAGFLAGLPIGFVIAAIPDAAALFYPSN